MGCRSLIALTLVGIGGWLGISRICGTTTLIGERKLPAAIILGNVRGQTPAMLQYMLEVSNRRDDVTAQASFKKVFEQKPQAEMALTDIQNGSQRVFDATKGISDSVEEQKATTQNISQRIEAVAKMSEGNSVAAEETAKVSLELDQLASSLIVALKNFGIWIEMTARTK